MKYIQNPKTKKYVKANGVLGKKIVAQKKMKGQKIEYFKDSKGYQIYQQDLKKRPIPIEDIDFCEKSDSLIKKSIVDISSPEESFWREYLNKKIEEGNVCIVSQPPDGNCLFHALASYISNVDAEKMRKNIVSYEKLHREFQIVQMMLVDSPDEFPEYEEYLQQQGLNFQELSKSDRFKIYLDVMGTDGVYGQNLEINAFTNIYNLNAIILTEEDAVNILIPETGLAKKTIFLYYTGIHYDVLFIESKKPSTKPKTVEKKPSTKPKTVEKKSAVKSKRCPKGTRKNKKTGECEPIKPKIVEEKPSTKPKTAEKKPVVKSKRCPKGTRKNKKTGECEPIQKKGKPKITQQKIGKIISDDLLNISTWKTQVAKKTGGNPAKIYISPEGTKYYGKIDKRYERVETELLASKLYNLAGILSANLSLAHDGKNYILLSKWNDTLSSIDSDSEQIKNKIKDGYIVDAWLANWDAYVGDNILITNNNQPIRLDVGGSLDYRAKGSKKGTGNTVPFKQRVGQLQSLVKYTRKSFIRNITKNDLIEQTEKLKRVSNNDIYKVVFENTKDKERAQKLYDILIARKHYIIQKILLDEK